MPLSLTYLAPDRIPVEVDNLLPERLERLTLTEISQLPIQVGNRQVPCGELFRIEGTPEDGMIRWSGDLRGVHWIGAKMSRGTMLVEGDAGRHIGSEMTGGTIEVQGSVGDWPGAEMHGGSLRIRGNAGHLVGAAYRGSRRGMTAGQILIEGSAGNEIGHTMRRGTIVIGGNVGDLIGFNMLAGTIFVFGECGIRHGAGMLRGTIGLFGKDKPVMLPSFRCAGPYSSPWLHFLRREFLQQGFPVPDNGWYEQCLLYHGDFLEGGRGEILTHLN